MFNNRSHTQITENELEATQKALAKLEQAYAENRMTKAMYMSRRERLVKNLERTVYAKTPLALNQDGFYGRDELNLSPRPTGYKESLMLNQELDGPSRKVSQSKIRQAELQNAYSDVSSESIMDRLQQNSAPSKFNAALNVVSDMRESKLLGTKRMSLDGVWTDISNTPAVVNALAKLSDSVRTRVEGAINEGIPVSAAKNYILSNARNAGAALTSEGYDRQRAAEIVTSVVNGEMNLIAAQNMVSADLREATRAITSNNLVNNEVIPNLAPVNTNAMPIKELVEVRNAAIDTLADPMADQDELDWAANFVQQANNTLNQRASENNVITGNSANQILISTAPAVKQAENRRQKELEMQRIAQQKRIESELAEKQRLEAAKAAREAARLEKERLAKIAAEAAMREAEEKARKAAANKAKRDANALAKKKANEARRTREAALKAKLEEEARQAKMLEAKKKKEEAAAAAAAKKAAKEKAESNRLAKLKAKEEEQAKVAELNEMPVNFAVMPMPPTIPKPTPMPKPMPTVKPAPRVDPSIIKAMQMAEKKPAPKPMPATVKPGPRKEQIIRQKPAPPQKAPTVRPVVKPPNKRSPAQKVANAIARLPSQQNVERSRGRPTKKAPVRTPTRQSIERDIKAGRRPVLGSTSSTTSTSHDPRRFHREESAGLGASTSTTTSSRTSGAYRFEDPRLGYRWG